MKSKKRKLLLLGLLKRQRTGLATSAALHDQPKPLLFLLLHRPRSPSSTVPVSAATASSSDARRSHLGSSSLPLALVRGPLLPRIGTRPNHSEPSMLVPWPNKRASLDPRSIHPSAYSVPLILSRASLLSKAMSPIGIKRLFGIRLNGKNDESRDFNSLTSWVV